MLYKCGSKTEQTNLYYSKPLRYTTLSCTDLTGARFWIMSKEIWDERIYVVKTLSSMFLDQPSITLLSNQKLHKFWAALVFLSPKSVHLKALLYCLIFKNTFLIGK